MIVLPGSPLPVMLGEPGFTGFKTGEFGTRSGSVLSPSPTTTVVGRLGLPFEPITTPVTLSPGFKLVPSGTGTSNLPVLSIGRVMT